MCDFIQFEKITFSGYLKEFKSYWLTVKHILFECEEHRLQGIKHHIPKTQIEAIGDNSPQQANIIKLLKLMKFRTNKNVLNVPGK